MSTTFKLITTITIASCAALLPTGLRAQTVLDGYISEAFKNNDGLKQQQFQLSKSLSALKEAKTLFYPNVSLLGSYVRSEGGRTIDLPIGDLLNPVYTSLNHLTESNSFPHVDNQSVQLNPDNFYDARFHTTLPLINTEIIYNKRIKQQAITLQQAAVNVYKRELVKNIKTAYYQYYQADKAVAIYNNALKLINENIRVNESLLRNGVRNSTALTRSQTEKQKIDASISEAENNRHNAQAYFNFLLNRPFDENVIIDTNLFRHTEVTLVDAGDAAEVAHREELAELNTKTAIYSLDKKLEQSYILPKLNTFLDLGSQGFNWQFDNSTRYYFFGVNLEWDLFAWGQHTHRIRQAQADVSTTKAQYDEAEKSFQLQLTQSNNNYNTAVANYNSAIKQLELADKYYSDQLKTYKEGQLLYIELLDAENQLTTAQLQLSAAFANVQIAQADIERNKATYPLN